MLSTQAFINMAVAVSLFPVTGQPLPLISRGGTSTLITCAYFGLILSADRFGIGKKKKDDVSVQSDSGHNEADDDTGYGTSDDIEPTEPINKLEDKVEFEIYQV